MIRLGPSSQEPARQAFSWGGHHFHTISPPRGPYAMTAFSPQRGGRKGKHALRAITAHQPQRSEPPLRLLLPLSDQMGNGLGYPGRNARTGQSPVASSDPSAAQFKPMQRSKEDDGLMDSELPNAPHSFAAALDFQETAA